AIGYRVFNAEGSGSALLEVVAQLPKGARIIATDVAQDRIAVTVDMGGTIEIRTFDLKTLRPAGRLRFATEPARPGLRPRLRARRAPTSPLRASVTSAFTRVFRRAMRAHLRAGRAGRSLRSPARQGACARRGSGLLPWPLRRLPSSSGPGRRPL